MCSLHQPRCKQSIYSDYLMIPESYYFLLLLWPCSPRWDWRELVFEHAIHPLIFLYGTPSTHPHQVFYYIFFPHTALCFCLFVCWFCFFFSPHTTLCFLPPPVSTLPNFSSFTCALSEPIS